MGPTIATGSVFARSFSTLSARFGPLFGSVLILYLPLIAATALVYQASLGDSLPFAVLALGVVAFVILIPMSSAAVIRGVFLHQRGEAVGLEDCWRGLGPVLLKVIVLSIAVGILTWLGYVFCIVPGFIVQAGLFVAIPALVVERSGVSDAFNRSWSLTEGHRLPIFFILLGLGVLTFAIAFAVGMLLGYFGLPQMVVEVLTQIVQALVTTLQAVVTAVVYFDLREIREGLGLDDLASVFD